MVPRLDRLGGPLGDLPVVVAQRGQRGGSRDPRSAGAVGTRVPPRPDPGGGRQLPAGAGRGPTAIAGRGNRLLSAHGRPPVARPQAAARVLPGPAAGDGKEEAARPARARPGKSRGRQAGGEPGTAPQTGRVGRAVRDAGQPAARGAGPHGGAGTGGRVDRVSQASPAAAHGVLEPAVQALRSAGLQPLRRGHVLAGLHQRRSRPAVPRLPRLTIGNRGPRGRDAPFRRTAASLHLGGTRRVVAGPEADIPDPSR